MTLVATLAATTLSPIMKNGEVVAFGFNATVAGRQRRVLVSKQHAAALTNAITQDGDRKIVIQGENDRVLMIESKDEGLRDAIQGADSTKEKAENLADPLGSAYGELQLAEVLLRAARADEIIRPDVPADWVATHEKHVADIKARIVSLGGEI